jgi:hypothetical protein
LTPFRRGNYYSAPKLRNRGKLRKDSYAIALPARLLLRVRIILCRLINTCWFVFKIAIALVVVLVVAVGIFLYTRMDSEIRHQVELALKQQFPHLNVSVGRAALVEGRGIEIHDLMISETTSTQLQNNLLVIDEMLLDCDVQLHKLMKGKPKMRRILVRHPQLWVARETDGRFNLESLWPPPSCGDSPPQIIIEDARLTLIDRQNPQAVPISLRDVHLTIQAAAEMKSTAPGEFKPSLTTCDVEGTLGGPHFQKAEFNAVCNFVENSIRVNSKFSDLKLSKDLLSWAEVLFGPAASQVKVQGSLDGEVTASYQFGGTAMPQVQAKLAFSQGRVEHPRLPRALTDLSCEIRIENETTFVEGLRCNCGSSGLAMQMERRGWLKTAPLSLSARAENFSLDAELFNALPPQLQAEWNKYKPTGTVDADLQLTFDGATWRPAATLTGRNLSFEADKFPYRVTDGSGTVSYSPKTELQQAQLTLDLTGIGGGQPLRISGQVFDPQPGAQGWVEITGSNVEIEERMIAALPEKVRRVISSLHPEGRFNVRWHIHRSLPGQLKPVSSLRLELVNCRVNYERFPYPLSGIRGLIQAEDNRWSFRDLVSGGARNVECEGSLVPTDTGSELSLQFVGKEVPLDDDLLRALPPSVQKAWSEIRPRGRVDLVAEIFHSTGLPKPSIRVAVRPRADSTSIEPRFFPYQMNLVDGTFRYQDGNVTLTEINAAHGRTTVRTNGSAEFRPDGGWQVQLENLTAERLAAKRDLIDALPLRLQKIIEQLHPTGNNFALNNGIIRFSRDPLLNGPITSQWDVELDCHQTDIQTGIDLQNIHGTVRLMGFSDGTRCESAGELNIDTVTFQDVQFTDVRGPLFIDEASCLVGQWACEKQGLPVRHMTGKVYDGTLNGDIWVAFDALPKYRADATITDLSLARLMTERFHSAQAFNGKVAASASLQGTGRSLHALTGNGEIKVTEANIYELPLLMGMLKVLRNGTPDTTAFNQTDVKFRIQGPHVYLDQLDFLGDAVSLYGQGTMGFNQELQLMFHGVLGRNEARLPFVKNLIDRTGQQFMQMYVDGTVGNPQIHTQPLPGINQLIQQIQTELDTSTPAAPVRQAERTESTFPVIGR